ncbi:SDR family oxidoreductase [Agaribacterium haliotis]|uniref:SDR family oxidoreductase n=1 Tax=Agaribacterium haliotis TaxID=2013869 RepID=UPI000BB58C7D|nr:SDR family oxidoreductase [Agaribacterium haliotis]
MWDFSGQVVVVIGGSSGINRAIAEAFASAGAKLAVASRNRNKVDATVKALRELGADATGFCADVRDPEALERGLAEAAERFGKFDVVVSGAAGNFPALASAMSSNAFKSVVDIDLLGTFHVMRAVEPYLTQPGASLINISAPQAQLAMAGQAHVCAAKAGVDMLTRCLALEWGGRGLRVNSVMPGPVDGTEGMRRLAPSAELSEQVRQSVPLKRLGQTSDIAHACLFLSSPWASFINGVVLPVDGGWSLGGVSSLGPVLEQALASGKR